MGWIDVDELCEVVMWGERKVVIIFGSWLFKIG